MKKRVIEIVANNLNLDALEIENNSIRVAFNETEGWDSLAHLSIMTDLEDEFDLEIEIDEMEELIDIDKIVQYLSQKNEL